MRLPISTPPLAWLAAQGWLKMLSSGAAPAKAREPRIGLALSCGAARGLAHIGVIQVLERERIPVSATIGTSMGAYVGALWGAGVSGDELEKLAAEIKDRRTLLRLMDVAVPPLKGFIHGHKVRSHLERNLGGRTLGDLERQTFIVATNLDTVSSEVLPPETPAAAAVQASCAIPGIVSPVLLNGKRYTDGGASQPLPVSLLRRLTRLDAVIAVNVMPTFEDVAGCQLKSYPLPPPMPVTLGQRLLVAINSHLNLFAHGNVLDTFKRCLTSAQMRLIAEEGSGADVLIHPFHCESRWHDFHKFSRYIEAGRHDAEVALPRIRELLKTLSHPNEHETLPLISPVGCGRA